MPVSASDIVKKAREALETPWRHQGRLVPAGVDCAGLILWTGRKLGLLDPAFEPPPYGESAKWEEFLSYFEAHMDRGDRRAPKAGEVIVFRQHIYPCHCGIMTADGSSPAFIHSYRLRDKVVEEGYIAPWPILTRAVFRYRGAA
jgi:cell wall-associated NlpC family hydrolase